MSTLENIKQRLEGSQCVTGTSLTVWDIVIDRLKSILSFGTGFARILSHAVLWQGSNLAIICLNKQTQKTTTVQAWDIM